MRIGKIGNEYAFVTILFGSNRIDPLTHTIDSNDIAYDEKWNRFRQLKWTNYYYLQGDFSEHGKICIWFGMHGKQYNANECIDAHLSFCFFTISKNDQIKSQKWKATCEPIAITNTCNTKTKSASHE